MSAHRCTCTTCKWPFDHRSDDAHVCSVVCHEYGGIILHNPRLEEIAAAHLIFPQDRRTTKLRNELASLRPGTLVSDDNSATKIKMIDLAYEHFESGKRPEWLANHDPMTLEEAWEWACRDLVFGGFHTVGQPPQ